MRIVMLVRNNVVGDSRVLKSARTAVDAGHEVVVLGVTTRQAQRPENMDGAPVVRVPVPSEYYDREHVKRLQTERAGIERRRRAAWASYARRRATTSSGWAAARWRHRAGRAEASDEPSLGATIRTARDTWLARVARLAPYGIWHTAAPFVVDLENALMPLLEQLEPDVIHVHDPHPLPAAVRYRAAVGRRVAVVYDAHEHWASVAPRSLADSGLWGIERELVRCADAVVTVNPVLAERLRRQYRLARTPTVVQNFPQRHSIPAAGRTTVRTELSLGDDVPLLVYAGGLRYARGVQDAVSALTMLPGVHLAVLANPDSKMRIELSDLAEDLGVGDRLHHVDYVPAPSVPWYLSDASIGLSPLHRDGNHDVALPTKVVEYLSAGLPVVVSACPAQAGFVRNHEVGLVHTPGDPQDLAAKVQSVIAEAPALRERANEVTATAALSWESQERTLLSVYERVAVADPDERSPRGGTTLIAPTETLRRLPDSHDAVTEIRYRSGPVSTAVALNRAWKLRTQRRVLAGGPIRGFGFLASQSWEVLDLLSAWGVEVAMVLGAESAGVSVDSATIRVLVTSPELLATYPSARWLPLIADPTALAAGRQIDAAAPIRVVGHHIDTEPATLDELRKWARSVGAKVQSIERWSSDVDMFVDDLTLATDRQLAVDCLAAGTIVVGATSANRDRGRPPIPIVSATGPLLRASLDLLGDPRYRRRARSEAVLYAQTWFDGRAARRILAERDLSGAASDDCPHPL